MKMSQTEYEYTFSMPVESMFRSCLQQLKDIAYKISNEWFTKNPGHDCWAKFRVYSTDKQKELTVIMRSSNVTKTIIIGTAEGCEERIKAVYKEAYGKDLEWPIWETH